MVRGISCKCGGIFPSAWPSHRTAITWRPPRIRRKSTCGISSPAGSWACSKATRGASLACCLAPTANGLFSGGSDTTARSWDLTRLTGARTSGLPTPRPSCNHRSLDALWTDLAGKDATRAFDAIRKLSASPDQAVALIQERVRPASSPDPKRLAQLLADLENGRVELRRQAESELEGLGDLAEPALRKALDGEPPLVLRRRVERLLDKLYVPTPGQMRDLARSSFWSWLVARTRGRCSCPWLMGCQALA